MTFPEWLSPYWRHLRVPFQLTLAPLFLWGFFLGRGDAGAALLLGFVSLHFFLYPGITAFNSAYDRDTGPVSGMLAPPPVPPRLLAFSLVLQAIGAAIAAAVNPPFLAIYLLIALLAAAYSHPRTRWKASPWGSALTVAVGQGALGFAAGWCAAANGLAGLGTSRAMLGAVTAALTTLAVYPATQVFQTKEDEARGDRTLALMLGPAGALRFGALCLAGAGAATTWLLARDFGAVDAALAVFGFAALILHQELFARALAAGRLSRLDIYRRAMRIRLLASGGFVGFMAVRVLAGWSG